MKMKAVIGFALWAAAAAGAVTPFQFEILGASGDWMVVRENIPSSAADTDACRYPEIDPSEYIGARVHFVRMSAEMKRGKLAALGTPDRSITLYAPGRAGEGCTPADEADQRWHEITAHAKELGVSLSARAPTPVVLGGAVPSKDCVLIAPAGAGATPCRRIFRTAIHGVTMQIAVSLTAVPEAPNEQSCQFTGHRFAVAIQAAGPGFGQLGAAVPGGFFDHYDCRPQQFDPLRLYVFEGLGVLLGDFRGTNIADRTEHPFVMALPSAR
jgi:hypothetical protein